MKEVLLSHDSKICIYSVPDEVAENLQSYCLEFCVNWIWENPHGAKLLKTNRGTTCAVYGAPDFIEYLNDWVFPEQKSQLIKQLDFYNYELPMEYKDYPQFNF